MTPNIPAQTTARPLILNLALTGMVPSRSSSPKIPLQPAEVVADVLAAAELGITIAHLHARDENDEPTHSKEIYARIIGGIREHRPDLVLCVSCSGRKARLLEERAEVLDLDGDLKPDMASLTVSSLNFSNTASINEPGMIKDLAQRMLDRGIKPEIEIFDLGMVNMLKFLQTKGLVQGTAYANILFGNVAGAQADLLEIGAMTCRLPAGTIYSLAGMGASQLPVAAIAAAMAPGVRIGLEDNLWLDAGRKYLATNVELVERVHSLARLMNREIMSPRDFRSLLDLPAR